MCRTECWATYSVLHATPDQLLMLCNLTSRFWTLHHLSLGQAFARIAKFCCTTFPLEGSASWDHVREDHATSMKVLSTDARLSTPGPALAPVQRPSPSSPLEQTSQSRPRSPGPVEYTGAEAGLSIMHTSQGLLETSLGWLA